MNQPQENTAAAPSTSDWGAQSPSSKKPRSGRRKALGAGAAAAVLAVGGGAAIWAADSSADADTESAAPGGGTGMGGPGGSGSRALHGEFVVSDGNGGYTTQLTQTGKVTELSATSLTAVSDDGYSKVYTIDSSVVSGVETGDAVTVVATTSGTAESVRESTGDDQGPPGGGTPPGQ